jgi:hypothetical protein
MIKKLNNALCQDIIYSDFFITSKGKYKIKLNIVSLLKNLKQFIRVLRFLKSFQKSEILFNLKKNNDFFLIKKCLIDIESKFHFFVFNKKQNLNLQKKEPIIRVFLNFVNTKNKKLTNNFLNNFIFMLVSVQLNKKENIYNIRNNLDNLKKNIFFLLLIQKVLK